MIQNINLRVLVINMNISKFLNRVSSQQIPARLRQLRSQRGPNGPTGTLALLDAERASSRGHVIAPTVHATAKRQKQLNVLAQTDLIALKDRIRKFSNLTAERSFF